tara:strand:- start:410 stop:1411 length:1002 start_codon:yes stop_codon:yes gene_type:complete
MLNRKPKIYFGPMSKNIVDVLLELSHDFPIGFIPSRRQVEYDGGYVNAWTSEEFHAYVKNSNPNVLVCRDHGGRLQGSMEDDGVLSLSKDSEIGFDILHIDPWKKFTSLEEMIDETAAMIQKCLSINPKINFEIGTEQAIHHYTPETLEAFLTGLRVKLGEMFNSIIYVVVQFGTAIVGTRNVGDFNLARAKKMIRVVKQFNLLSKEHNGDYLTYEQLSLRFNLGLDAINIAPEFGVFETKCLIDSLSDNLEFKKLEKFYTLAKNSNKWQKWIPNLQSDENNRFQDYLISRVCGHYIFNQEEVVSWKRHSDLDIEIKNKLKDKLSYLLGRTYA